MGNSQWRGCLPFSMKDTKRRDNFSAVETNQNQNEDQRFANRLNSLSVSAFEPTKANVVYLPFKIAKVGEQTQNDQAEEATAHRQQQQQQELQQQQQQQQQQQLEKPHHLTSCKRPVLNAQIQNRLSPSPHSVRDTTMVSFIYVIYLCVSSGRRETRILILSFRLYLEKIPSMNFLFSSFSHWLIIFYMIKFSAHTSSSISHPIRFKLSGKTRLG